MLTMKTMTIAFVGIALAGLTACGPMHTNHQPYAQVGYPLVVEVNVPDDQLTGATGQVHYMLPGSPGYIALPLQQRGNVFWQSLPTADVPAGLEARYYFDVVTPKNTHALASPAKPYVTQFVPREDVIYHNLSAKHTCGKAGQPITFELRTGSYKPSEVLLHIERPDERGHRIVPLPGRNWFKHTIKDDKVVAGRWRYWFTVTIEDVTYQVPDEGPTEFLINAP
jgi:hypothetical protein